MTEKTPLTLTTPDTLRAAEAELAPLFDATASVPTQAALQRLLADAESIPTRSSSWGSVRALVALAAIGLLAVGLGRWTVPTPVTEVAVAVPVTEVGGMAVIDDLAWHDDDLGDGLDLLGLPLNSDDPQRAIELVDVLIAELDDV